MCHGMSLPAHSNTNRSASMDIYKPKPYVYRLDNPITGEFYIGYVTVKPIKCLLIKMKLSN